MKKLLVVLVFIGALAGVLYIARSGAVRIPNLPIPESPASNTESSSDDLVRTVREETPAYNIDVTFKLSGIAVVDQHIQDEVENAITAFRNEAASFDPQVMTRPYTFTGDVADMYVGSDVVSTRINLYQDTGGAHGMPIVLALNYNARTGETITLDRVLALIGKTLDQVAASARTQLAEEFGDSVFPEGVTAKPENYQTFTMNGFNVTFVFQAYQAVPYAAGMPEVTFARMDE